MILRLPPTAVKLLKSQQLAAVGSLDLTDHASDNAKDAGLGVRYDPMMPNDPFNDAIDVALRELRDSQDHASLALRDSLAGAAASLRESAWSEARAQIEALAAERLESALAGARADAEQALAGARADAEQALAAARAEGEQALAAARAGAADDLSKAIADVRLDADRARVAAETAAAEQLSRSVDQARAAAEAAAGVRIAEALAAARADSERALAQVRTQQVQTSQGGAARLLKAVRDFDRAGSLSEVLDALVDHARGEVPRVAVLLVQGDQLRGWRFAGLDEVVTDPRSMTLSLSDPDAGVLAAAVRTRMPSSTGDGRTEVSPSFALLERGFCGLAVPIEVGGRIVAVVYADDQGETGSASPGWREASEVLARHAARCLEALTAVRMRTALAPSRPDEPAAAGGSGVPDTAGSAPAGDNEAARRFAKLLISEIRLYHEGAVNAGRRERNLLERLRDEIERARSLYNARIPAAARADHFNQELIRTLADGDPALLGHPA